MQRQYRQRRIPAGNPLANALVVIVGTLAIAASVILGVVAFVVLASIVLVFAALVGIRVWWQKRRLMRSDRGPASGGKQAPNSDSVIEGEYRVIASGKDTESRG